MKFRLFGVVGACAFTFVTLSAEAALVSRLNGHAVYDTDLGITWLADANYAQTSGYDTDGMMTAQDARTWAAQLEFGGFSDWRLPMSDGQSFRFGCLPSECDGSELSHLLNSESAGLELFSNIQQTYYWYGTDYPSNPGFPPSSYFYHVGTASQNYSYNTAEYYAFAVRDGDVSAVPIPATVWLFGSGLIGLIGMARRKAT